MNPAKIRLSTKELELVTNADWLLTKNQIIRKAILLFEQLLTEQKEAIQSQVAQLPDEVIKPQAKISKGENYKGLPYLVLDHPRCFNKNNIFAIRTMFWWGNFFSVTLHLAGVYKKRFTNHILSAKETLEQHDFFICVNDEEWEHHFEESNYVPVRAMNGAEFENYADQKPFIKLAYKISLQHWEDSSNALIKKFEVLLSCLISCQGGEKGLSPDDPITNSDP